MYASGARSRLTSGSSTAFKHRSAQSVLQCPAQASASCLSGNHKDVQASLGVAAADVCLHHAAMQPEQT